MMSTDISDLIGFNLPVDFTGFLVVAMTE